MNANLIEDFYDFSQKLGMFFSCNIRDLKKS